MKTIKDNEFIRGNVPMTKEEIRTISLAKLSLNEAETFWDIGSGTGSIAVQAAVSDKSLNIYAIEKNDEGIELIGNNIAKFKADNIKPIKAEAPDYPEDIEVPDAAFVGGSGGRLKEIVLDLKKRNPHIRIVINAVTLETVSIIKELLEDDDIKNSEMIQLSVSRVQKIGAHHMLRAETPVYVSLIEYV